MKIKEKLEHGLHYHNGLKYYGLYKNGKEDGKWTIENINHILSTCEFRDGENVGKMEVYNDNGKVVLSRDWESGKYELDKKWDIKELKNETENLFKKYLEEDYTEEDRNLFINILWGVLCIK
jgi:antitoxin component YwqK of YwqJK toxin-antitoxin module